MKRIIVSGVFDDLRLLDFRFLDEAAKLGGVHVLLWSDAFAESQLGKAPKFSLAERQYLVNSIRFVNSISVCESRNDIDPFKAEAWAIREGDRFASAIAPKQCPVITDAQLKVLPSPPEVPSNPQSSRKKVVVTGCYDWFHSGHVRFFEEVSDIGDLYVVVGHDENIKLLKGEGHPLFPDAERRYIAGTIRFVKLSLISTGSGWMDAEPEFIRIKPDIYAVNEDGDKPEKLQFCLKYGIEYRVLKRLPKQGLPRRQSTSLRGF